MSCHMPMPIAKERSLNQSINWLLPIALTISSPLLLCFASRALGPLSLYYRLVVGIYICLVVVVVVIQKKKKKMMMK